MVSPLGIKAQLIQYRYARCLVSKIWESGFHNKIKRAYK